MRNCVRTYGHNVKHNLSRLWSVRKDGKRIATLEIGNHGRQPFPYVGDLRSAGNEDAPAEAWWAAERWLLTHDLPRLNTNRFGYDAVPIDRTAWMALWKPYWLAKRRFPEWLPADAFQARARKASEPADLTKSSPNRAVHELEASSLSFVLHHVQTAVPVAHIHQALGRDVDVAGHCGARDIGPRINQPSPAAAAPRRRSPWARTDP